VLRVIALWWELNTLLVGEIAEIPGTGMLERLNDVLFSANYGWLPGHPRDPHNSQDLQLAAQATNFYSPFN
jgi:hypothetical protein